jgi:hypothetical protein
MPFVEQDRSGNWVRKEEVRLSQLGGRGKTHFRLLDRFGYLPVGADADPATFVAPIPEHSAAQGEPTDLASIPPFLWGIIASYGGHTMPALVHDHLCSHAKKQGSKGRGLRRMADKFFRTMLRDATRVGIVTRWLMWAAIRNFAFPIFGLAVVALGLYGTLYVLPPTTSWVDGPNFRLTGAALIVAIVVMSIVFAREGPPELTVPPNARTAYRPTATASLLGAALIGVCAAALFAPVVVVTVVTKIVLGLADVVAFCVSFLVRPITRRLSRGYPSVDWAVDTTSPGDEPVPAFGRFFAKG